ncbi:MAG: MFS transporter [Acidithiobacillus ferrivorans]
MRQALPFTVLVLGLVSFFNDLASEMVVPLIPVLLATILAAGPVALGLVEGVADTVASFLKLWSGRHSDLIGGRRKGLTVIGYTVSNLARPLIAVVASWPVLLLVRSIDRMGKGIRTAPRDALLADSTPPERIGFAFGYQRAMDNGGAVLGALVAAAVLHFSGIPFEDVILLSAIPGAVAILLLGGGVREVQRPPNHKTPARISLNPHHLSPHIRRYLLTLSLFTLARATETFILLRAYQLGMDVVQVLLLWASIHAAKSSTGMGGGRLADKLGRRPVLFIGWSAYGCNYALFAMVESLPLLWAVALSYGLFFGFSEGAERAQINDLTTADERGTAFGWYNLATGISAIPAGLLFGWIWEEVGAPYAFGFSACIAIAATTLLATWVYRGTPWRQS